MAFLYPRRQLFLPSRYHANAVNADGVNDFLTRDAGLTGASDGKQITFSCWIKNTSDGVTNRMLGSYDSAGGGAAAQSLRIQRRTTNDFQVAAENAAGTVILNVNSTAGSAEAADGWLNLLWSSDQSDTGKRHLYINDVSDLASVSTYTDDTIDLTNGDWAIAGVADGSTLAACDLAELWFAATYIDFSVTANRRLFYSAGGRPVFLGADGSRPTGSQPLVYMTGATSSWETNKGSGGGFTEHGALTDASTSPS